MKLYNRTDFLKLPEGTIFCKGKPYYFEDLSVKGESLPNDFIYLGLQWIDSNGEDDCAKLDDMLYEGESCPLQTAYGRDGCFNDEDIFLVYEDKDIENIMSHLDAAYGLKK